MNKNSFRPLSQVETEHVSGGVNPAMVGFVLDYYGNRDGDALDEFGVILGSGGTALAGAGGVTALVNPPLGIAMGAGGGALMGGGAIFSALDYFFG